MPTAHLVVAESDCKKQRAYAAGLERAGFRVSTGFSSTPQRGDVLVIWNRHSIWEPKIRRYEQAGCKIIVTENGYTDGYRAMALWHHNGPGEWRVGEHDRWADTGIELAPWREDGDHILVLPQRGIGEVGVRMPRIWLPATLAALKKSTKRRIVVRRHPGKEESRSLSEDLQGAWAAVTWASSAGIKALIAGVPVFYGLPGWIGAGAADRFSGNAENPTMGDRLPAFRRMAWAQWTNEEIESGEAVRWLLNSV